ncbi:MAG: Xaa-Pro peptidase family protein [Planctomycetota bacterium]|nr:Xaa-Pro peptidase family protein [Planctomycetota bacterium]
MITTLGVGGATQSEALARLADRTAGITPISMDELEARRVRAQLLMRDAGLEALYLHAGSNLNYFTGTAWHASERIGAAILPAEGPIEYIAPAFERGTFESYLRVAGEIRCWEEHESPYALLASRLAELGVTSKLGLDEATPFFALHGIRTAAPHLELCDAQPVTQGCRSQKSAAELALMQRAKDMTLEVHQAAATILRPGISTVEVSEFIDRAHRAVGAARSSFCIVLFGPDSAFPHGVKTPKALDAGDVVLIDTGCLLHGYNSDITRTYVLGEPTARQREVWDVERAAQAAAFAAAQPGVPCGDVDRAAREVIEQAGFGPGYALPGLPHRTGHGIGLDIHEGPYLVGSDRTPLAEGMCFSNEPMICVPGEFGVRLEDHFYMTADGPRWFTRPSPSIEDPFGLA